MRKPLFLLCLLAYATVAHAAAEPIEGERDMPKIHAVTDIGHEFTFYFDGRFGRQYIEPSGGAHAQNWATLREYDLDNVNLLILQSGASPCPYPPEDVEAVRAFLSQGGGVAVMGDRALFRDD